MPVARRSPDPTSPVSGPSPWATEPVSRCALDLSPGGACSGLADASRQPSAGTAGPPSDSDAPHRSTSALQRAGSGGRGGRFLRGFFGLPIRASRLRLATSARLNQLSVPQPSPGGIGV